MFPHFVQLLSAACAIIDFNPTFKVMVKVDNLSYISINCAYKRLFPLDHDGQTNGFTTIACSPC